MPTMQRGSELQQQQQQQQQQGYFKLSTACKACARNQRRLFEAGTREKTISYIIAHRFKPQGGGNQVNFLLGTCCWPLRGPIPLLQCILMANNYTVKYLSTPGYKQTTNDL